MFLGLFNNAASKQAQTVLDALKNGAPKDVKVSDYLDGLLNGADQKLVEYMASQKYSDNTTQKNVNVFIETYKAMQGLKDKNGNAFLSAFENVLSERKYDASGSTFSYANGAAQLLVNRKEGVSRAQGDAAAMLGKHYDDYGNSLGDGPAYYNNKVAAITAYFQAATIYDACNAPEKSAAVLKEAGLLANAEGLTLKDDAQARIDASLRTQQPKAEQPRFG